MRDDITKLVEGFAESTALQNQAIMRGDATQGNRHAKRRIQCAHRLMKLGDNGTEALATLFDHPDPGVREMAAVYLLKRRTDQALAILHNLATVPGLVGFGAEQAIQRWNEGSWDLEPEE